MSIADLKANVNLRDLVARTHDILDNKILCPAHSDTNPSCHVYDDHLYCFACGWRGDVLDWLQEAHLLSFDDALIELRRLAAHQLWAGPHEGPAPAERATPTRVPPEETRKSLLLTTIRRHQRLAAQLRAVPGALRNRGFTLGDLRRLGVAAIGETAVLPIPDPEGRIVALKQRFHTPRAGRRYRYLTPGVGAPPWCSPGFANGRIVLVIEGELNGMAAWLARPEIAVMGVAGVGGPLLPEALRDKIVFVHADFDDPGVTARARWCAQALEAGALKVRSVEPWPDGDACDIAGAKGRAALRERLP